MFKQLTALTQRPKLYEKGSAPSSEIWTDEHISKGMLEAHLNPDWDAATRNHAFVRDAVKWIASTAPAEKYPALLDLGCGPGLYSELFHQAGYKVTGMDFSERSIKYARNSAKEKNLPIEYMLQDYFKLNLSERFDIVTLIYYEYGTFPPEDRVKLLKNIRAALKPNGLLIFDVNAPQYLADREESTSWNYINGGFYTPRPYIELCSTYLYEEKRTKCDRHIIITEEEIESFNLWEHTFTKEELTQTLTAANFTIKSIQGSAAGTPYTEEGIEMCVVAKKPETV